MKKIGVSNSILAAFIILSILFLSVYALAENVTVNQSSTITQTVVIEKNQSKIDKGYQCLENKTRGKCSSLSVSEIALTILAVPAKDVLSECKTALTGKKDSKGCWPSGNCNIKDTALAVLALDRLGEKTEDSQKWLLTQNRTATDIIWYLEQDSKEASACTFSYDSSVNAVNIREDKKIDGNAGSCLGLAQSGFWLQISPSCYNKDFAVSCDKDFLTTLLYRQSNSNTIFVLSDAETKPGFGTVTVKVKSQCFGSSSSCDYESSAWATLALLKTGKDVSDFIPYVLAMGDSNSKYLPNAFIYLITNYEDYATKLIQQQQLGNYWQADNTAYDKFYDTALGLLSLGDSSAIQVSKAQQWIEFSQQADGCWQNIRDTAIVLWSITDRNPDVSINPTTEYCEQNDFFCVQKGNCKIGTLKSNYYCSSVNSECCSDQNLKTCVEYSGKTCATGEICSGQSKKASDTENCCLTSCEKEVTQPGCESGNYGYCRASCTETEEIASGNGKDCNAGMMCCAPKTVTPSSKWWIWVLIILIIVVALAIVWIKFKDQIKLWWFKVTKKDKGSQGGGQQLGSGRPPFVPPRPSIPPAGMQRPMMSRPPMPPQPSRMPPGIPPRR